MTALRASSAADVLVVDLGIKRAAQRLCKDRHANSAVAEGAFAPRVKLNKSRPTLTRKRERGQGARFIAVQDYIVRRLKNPFSRLREKVARSAG
jgi:hypothetical protein